MRGTRPTADGRQEECSTLLVRLGFLQGFSPSNKSNMGVRAQRRVHCVWPCRFAGLVQDEHCRGIQRGTSLTHVMTWRADRVEYKADPKQAKRLLAECGVNGDGINQMDTPGVKTSYSEFAADIPVERNLHTPFRRSADH